MPVFCYAALSDFAANAVNSIHDIRGCLCISTSKLGLAARLTTISPVFKYTLYVLAIIVKFCLFYLIRFFLSHCLLNQIPHNYIESVRQIMIMMIVSISMTFLQVTRVTGLVFSFFICSILLHLPRRRCRLNSLRNVVFDSEIYAAKYF